MSVTLPTQDQLANFIPDDVYGYRYSIKYYSRTDSVPVAEQLLILRVTKDITATSNQYDATLSYQSTIYDDQSGAPHVDKIASANI